MKKRLQGFFGCNEGLDLVITKQSNPTLKTLMRNHYSKPKFFVGRVICYAIYFDNVFYGYIVGGSATLHLPGRNEFFEIDKTQLNNIVNNVFFSISKIDNKYPKRNFTSFVVREFTKKVAEDWELKYKDEVIGVETLIEKPRTGELYRRAGWTLVGETKGFTCKRIGGTGSTDGYTGQKVWNKTDLRPKLVYCYKV